MADAREGEPDVPIDVPVGPAPHERLYDYEVAPQSVAPSPLHAVAEALSPLSGDLQRLALTTKDKQDKLDRAQADQDSWNQNTGAAHAALANGTLPHDKSPAYMDAWGANAGLNDALRLQQSIGPQYNSLDKTTQDPQAFDKWFFPLAHGSANPALNGNSGYMKAYGAGIERLHAEMSGRYVTDRSEAVKSGAQQEFTAAIGNQVNVTWPTGDSPVDSVALASQLDQIRAKALNAGMDPAFVEKSVIDVIHTKALDHKSVAILPVLDAMTRNPSDPTSAKLSASEYGAAKGLETKSAVQTLLIQDRDRQQTQQKIEDEQGYKTAVTGMFKQWADNPNYAPSPEEIATASKHDPLFPSKIAELRKNVLANDTVEDPTAKATLYEDILAHGGGQQTVMDAIGHGTLKTASSIKEASEYANTVQAYNQTGGVARITEDPTFKRYVAVIESASKDPKWVSSVTGGTGVTLGGRSAVNDLTAAAMNWQLKNPGADPIARQQFLSKLGEGVMNGFGGNDTEGGAAMHPYTRPADVSSALTPAPRPSAAPTAAPTAAPLPPSQPQKPSPAGSSAAPGGSTGKMDTPENALATLKAMPTSPRFEDLPKLGASPEIIQELSQAAKDRGITPQQFLDTIHGGSPQEAPATPGKQGDATPPGDRVGALSLMPGLDPAVAMHVQHFVTQMQSLFPGASGPKAAATPEPVSQSRVAAMDASPAHDAIEKVAKESGMDPSQLKAMVSIESGGRATSTTGSYHGLLQLSHQEFVKYGHGDIDNPEDNLRAGVASIQDKASKFKEDFGREPTVSEQYLMHQQGEAGLRAHEANPEGLAWKNMASTGEGKSKGDAWAKQAIWGNVPSDMRPLFGSVENMTSAEFMAVWQHKLQGTPYNQALQQVTNQQDASNLSPGTQITPADAARIEKAINNGDDSTVLRYRKIMEKRGVDPDTIPILRLGTG